MKKVLFGIILLCGIVFSSCNQEKTDAELDQICDTLSMGKAYIENTLNKTYYEVPIDSVPVLPEHHIVICKH